MKTRSTGQQQGVGIIEVMVALFIIAFGALAIANAQTRALTSLVISTSHFSLSTISEEIAEHLKTDRAQATAGLYNTTFADTQAAATVPAVQANAINSWKSAAQEALNDGAAQVNCSATDCTISLRWREAIQTGVTQQFYHLKIPLEAL